MTANSNSVRAAPAGQGPALALLDRAKESKSHRKELVRALVTPGTWEPRFPEIPDRDLVGALRIAELSTTSTSLGMGDRAVAVNKKLREIIILALRFKTPPLFVALDIKQARRTIETVARFYSLDITPLRKYLLRFELERDILRNPALGAATSGQIVRQPKRGRRFSEDERRRIAAVQLLVECGETKDSARTQVAGALYSHKVKIEADSLRRLEDRYRKRHRDYSGRPDAFIPVEKLPVFWLERLSWQLETPTPRGVPPPR